MNKLMRRVMTCIVSAMCVLALFVPVYAEETNMSCSDVYLRKGDTKSVDLGLDENDGISSAYTLFDTDLISFTQSGKILNVTGNKIGQTELTVSTFSQKTYHITVHV